MKKLLFLIILCSSFSYASDYSFNSSLIDGGDVNSNILKKGYFPQGVYSVSVELNGLEIKRDNISFFDQGNGNLAPCLKESFISNIGLKNEFYKGYIKDDCFDIKRTERLKFTFDFYNRTLMLYVPDKYFDSGNREIAPESVWDDGVNAFSLNYNAIVDGAKYKNQKASSISKFIQVSPSINIDAWRLKNFSTWSSAGSTKRHWDNVNTFSERAINSIRSKLIIGQTFTQSDIFATTPFNGVMLSSDEKMIPFSQREYTPVVRGVADSVSTVEVIQNGHVISKTMVPAGSFEITDIPYNVGGDFNVMVTGNNGAKRYFTVPNLTPVLSLHEGYFKHSFMFGNYRGNNGNGFSQATMAYGFSGGIAGLGGYQFSKKYRSFAVGIGTTLGSAGAVSASLIGADSYYRNAQEGRVRYHTLDVKYNKMFDFGAFMAFNIRRNGKKGFLDLSSALNNYKIGQRKYPKEQYRYTLSLGQNLFGGSVNFHGDMVGYGGGNKKDISYGLNFHTQIFNKANLGIGVSRVKLIYNHKSRSEQLLNLWLNVPIGKNDLGLSYQMSKNNKVLANEVGVSGKAYNDKLVWDFKGEYRNTKKNHAESGGAGSLFLNYSGRSGVFYGNYSKSSNGELYSGGVSGTAVIYNKGLVLGQQQGDTIAIVEAGNISGASVGYWPGVSTDKNGKAISGYLTPYVDNIVSIDPLTIGDNSEIKINTLKVVPTDGAVVMAKFNTHTGKSLYIKLIKNDGSLIKFGSVVVVNDGKDKNPVTGIVNENSSVFLSGAPDTGLITVILEGGKRCKTHYSVHGVNFSNGVYRFISTCK